MDLSKVQIKRQCPMGVEALSCYNILIRRERHLHQLTCTLKHSQEHFYCGDFLRLFFLYYALLCAEACMLSVFLMSVLCSCSWRQTAMISFSFSSGSATLTDFVVSNKRSSSVIFVLSLLDQGQFRSQSRETSRDLLRNVSHISNLL